MRKVKGRSYLSDLSLTNRRFLYHIFFFDRCVVQIISFSGGIVLMGKAMYQSAFLSFENCLNSVVVGGALRDIPKDGCEGD